MKKPMLLSNDEFDLNLMDYSEMYFSKKRDGVRAETTNKGIQGRSLKRLKNVKLQDYFRNVYENLPDGIILECEIYSKSEPCRVVAGICNSDKHDIPEDLKLYIFGVFDEVLVFSQRMEKIKDIEQRYMQNSTNYVIVEQVKVSSKNQVDELYQKSLDDGYEGGVLMDGRKQYKQGRVTIKQAIGFKLKPHKEMDLKILGVTERFLNTNESQTNELGHSFKRNTVDAKQSTGIAATFICELPNGETTKVSLTGDENFRREIWQNQTKYIGMFAVVKSMDYGEKTKLRHPRLIDIKNQIEK